MTYKVAQPRPAFYNFDSDTLRQQEYKKTAGTYRIVVHYLGGDIITGDKFVVKPNYLAVRSLQDLAGNIQDISNQEQFSIKVNGNVVGIYLQHVTYVELEKV